MGNINYFKSGQVVQEEVSFKEKVYGLPARRPIIHESIHRCIISIQTLTRVTAGNKCQQRSKNKMHVYDPFIFIVT